MKIKQTKIKIGNFEDFKELVKRSVDDPKSNTGESILFVRDARTISKILSEKRLELMRAIKQHPEHNVSQLAKLLGRKQEAISRDLAILKAHGIAEVKRTKGVISEIKPSHVVIEI